MTTFKRLKFGLVPTSYTNQQIGMTEQILISYLRTTSATPTVLLDEETNVEIFKLAKQYIGPSFKDWLTVNYSNGTGTRAALCKAIVCWANGIVSSKAVTSEVRRDLNRIDFLKSIQDQVQYTFISNGDDEPNKSNITFDTITDRHYFEFLALLGPELLAHFLLSLDGIRFAW